MAAQSIDPPTAALGNERMPARSQLADDIASHLESLTTRIYDVMYGTRDFEDPVLDHLARDFKSVQEDDGRVFDWATCKRMLLTGENRCMQKEILQISTDVEDELRGRATVWMTLMVHYHGSTPANEAVVSLNWERRHGKWVCVRRKALRGLHSYF